MNQSMITWKYVLAHVLKIRPLKNYYILHLWSCALKLVRELTDVISAGIEFQRSAPKNEKLV